MSSKNLQLQLYNFLKLLMTCFINFANFFGAEEVPNMAIIYIYIVDVFRALGSL
jgi:hypothetical protein